MQELYLHLDFTELRIQEEDKYSSYFPAGKRNDLFSVSRGSLAFVSGNNGGKESPVLQSVLEPRASQTSTCEIPHVGQGIQALHGIGNGISKAPGRS